MTIEEILIAEAVVLAVLDDEKTTTEDFEKNTEELHKNEEETVEYTADAAKLTYQQRQELADSDFAYVKIVGEKKVRRFPIMDEAHVRNALARLSQAKGLSHIDRAAITAKIMRKVKKFNMKDLLEKHKKEACFTYEDVASFEEELRQTYANHIAPDKLDAVVAERVQKYLEDKAKAEKDAMEKTARYDERRKTLEAFTDEELKAYDILNDEIFDKLSKESQIKILQRNVSDLNWLKQQVDYLSKQLADKPQGSASGAEETPEQKTAREAKEVADKAEADRVAKEVSDKAAKDAAEKAETDRIAKEKADKDAAEKAAKDKEVKEAEEKAKKDAEGKLLVHGMPKVDESVKTQMREVTQKRGDK